LGMEGFSGDVTRSCDCHLPAAIKVNAARLPRGLWNAPLLLRAGAAQSVILFGGIAPLEPAGFWELRSRRAPRVVAPLGAGKTLLRAPGPARIRCKPGTNSSAGAARRRPWGPPAPLALAGALFTQRPRRPWGNGWRANLRSPWSYSRSGAGGGAGRRERRSPRMVGGPGAWKSIVPWPRDAGSGFSGGELHAVGAAGGACTRSNRAALLG